MRITMTKEDPAGRAGTLQQVADSTGIELIKRGVAVLGDQRQANQAMETADRKQVKETRKRK
jgi:hypothetical protein